MNKENFITNSNMQPNSHSILASIASPTTRKTQPKLILSQRNHQHDEFMRLIIAKNVQYFKSKIKGPQNGTGKDLKLKIPCPTGTTVYRKDYNEKQPKNLKQLQIGESKSPGNMKNKSTLKMCIQNIKLDDKTNYQQDFKNQLMHSFSCRRFNKKFMTTNQDDSPPGFFQTQNKSNFLNWGVQGYAPSLKPSYKSAATNLAFQATSSYRAEFDGKQTPATPICIKQSSFPKFGNMSMVIKSNYSHDYSQKKNNPREKTCKPKHMSKSRLQKFKGSTEYKRQFKKGRKQQNNEMEAYETLQDLQTLIIDL